MSDVPQSKSPIGKSCPCQKLPYRLSSSTAAEYGNVDELFRRGVDFVLRQQERVNDVEEKREQSSSYCELTPLHFAAQHGQVAATEALLSAGFNVNGYVHSSNEKDGRKYATPLHRASFSGAVLTIQLLLKDASCDLMIPDTSFGDQMTPLHKAVSGGRPLAVQLLLEAHHSRGTLSTALQALDASGLTPIQLALRKCPNKDSERASVARWNSVAGGEPDWETCAILLQTPLPQQQQQEKPNSQRSSLNSIRQLTPTNQLCSGCNSNNPVCPLMTRSWEQSFQKALFSNVTAIDTDDAAISPNIGSSSSLAAVDTNTYQSLISQSSRDENWDGDGDGTVGGAICERCGKRAIALYRIRRVGNTDCGRWESVCKKCWRKAASTKKAATRF